MHLTTVSGLAVCTCLVYCLAAEDPRQPREAPIHKISKRVVHGQPVHLGPIPYQVSIQVWIGFMWTHLCGGTLIADNKVLTAAHCVYTIVWTDIRVGLGWLHLHKVNGMEQNIGVTKIVVHSDYIPRQPGFPNDIAILTLATNASITQAVKTAPLAPATTLKSESMTGCVISGWGHMIGGIDGVLRETTIKVISSNDCSDRMSNITNAEIFDHHICVFETPKAACNGDSGGPLVCQGFLVGVSSYGVRSCTGLFPSVFGFVPHFHDWILTHLLD